MTNGYIMEFYFYVQDLFISAVYWYTLFIICVGIAYLVSGVLYNYKEDIKKWFSKFTKLLS